MLLARSLHSMLLIRPQGLPASCRQLQAGSLRSPNESRKRVLPGILAAAVHTWPSRWAFGSHVPLGVSAAFSSLFLLRAPGATARILRAFFYRTAVCVLHSVANLPRPPRATRPARAQCSHHSAARSLPRCVPGWSWRRQSRGANENLLVPFPVPHAPSHPVMA